MLTMTSDTLLPYVADLLLKSSGALLLAFGFSACARRSSAGHHSLVWLITFLVLAALPLIAVIPPWKTWVMELLSAPVSALPMEPGEAGVPLLLDSAEAAVPVSAAASASVPALLGAFWLAGVILLLGRQLIGQWQVQQLYQRSQALMEPGLRARLTMLARESGIARSIDWRVSAAVSVPLTWGAWRPVVLLPEEAMLWPPRAVDDAVRHELGHVRHGDALARGIAACVAALYWPNVLVWLALKAWRVAQERAADDAVIRAGTVTQDYAMQLLNAARRLRPGGMPPDAALAMARPSTLETRLSAIMDDACDRSPLRLRAWLAAGGAGLALFMACAALQVRAQSSDTSMTTRAKAERLVLSKITLRDATITDALAALREAAREQDPTGQGVPLVMEGTASPSRFSLNLIQVPLSEAVRYVATLAGVTARYDARGIILTAQPGGAPSSAPVTAPRREAPQAGKGYLQTFAESRVIAPGEWTGTTVGEAVELLKNKMKEASPNKQGIFVLVRATPQALEAKVTLDLENQTVMEALRRVAKAGGFQLVMEPYAFLLKASTF